MKFISKMNESSKEKKRDASEAITEKLKSPSNMKRKTKHHLEVVHGDYVIDQVNYDESLHQENISKKKIKPNVEIKKENAETSGKNIRDNVEGVEQTSAPGGAKKVPSRSARRKKVKRRWRQELAKISRNPDAHEYTNEIERSNNDGYLPQKKICMKKIIPNMEIKKENVETHDKIIRDDVEGQSSTAPNGAKKVPSRNTRRKNAKRRWKQELAKISQNPDTHEYTNEIGQAINDASFTQKIISKQKIIPNEEIKKEDTETWDKNIRDNVEGVEQTFTALDGAKKPDTHEYTNEIDQTNNDGSLPQKKICKKMIIPNEEIKKEPAETFDINVRNNFEGVEQTPSARAGAKKVPSRIAMRKKAKRRWRQELAKISRNPNTLDYTNEIDQANNDESLPQKKISKIKIIRDEEIKKEPVETFDMNIRNNFEGVEQTSSARVGPKKVPSRSAMRKKAKRRWRQELAKISRNFKLPAKVVHINIMEQEERNHNDGDEKQIKLPNVALRWNGITKKRKGQKWGLEKVSTFERDDLRKTTKESSSMLTVDTRMSLIHLIEFDQLPLCNSPKKGDVIAYRILELSSSWTPKLSSIAVGKISYYDADNIVLMPVPEYPIVFNKMDPDNSLYKEDGSLVVVKNILMHPSPSAPIILLLFVFYEIKFAALADVRSIEQSNSDAVKAVSDGVDPTPQGGENNAASNLISNSNDDRANLYKDPSPVIDNKDGNTWAEIDKLLIAKKSELLKVNQEMKKDSEGIKWSYRGSALGPTMALLRSKKYI